MPEINTKDLISKSPKWIFVAAFCVFVICFVASFFSEKTFKFLGYEFGYSASDEKAIKQSRDNTIYMVMGTVEKNDGLDENDVMIYPGYPPIKASADGVISGCFAWRNPNGLLPTLDFSCPGYFSIPINLNDDSLVEMREGNIIRIKNKVIIRKEPQKSAKHP